MKKIFVLMLVLTMVFSISACGSEDNVENPNANQPDNEQTGDEEKVSVLMFTSASLGDFRIIDSVWSGVQDACAKWGYEPSVIELGSDISIQQAALDDACSSGDYQYVVTGYQGMKDVYEEMAAKYPDITFIMYDVPTTYEVPSDNMIAISFKQNDGSYLAGIYSALMTKTGKVAAGLWDDNPILNDFGTGFVNGVKDANDMFGLDVEYNVIYFGGDTTDASGAYEIINTVYNDGYDIFYNVAGHVVLSATMACEEHGGYENGYFVIGVDTDQWMKYDNSPDVDAPGYENIATSVLKDGQSTISYVFDGLNDGSIKQGDLVITGLVEGGVRLAENENYFALTPQDVVEKINECQEKIVTGEKEVLSYFDFDTYEEYAEYRDDPDLRVSKP